MVLTTVPNFSGVWGIRGGFKSQIYFGDSNFWGVGEHLISLNVGLKGVFNFWDLGHFLELPRKGFFFDDFCAGKVKKYTPLWHNFIQTLIWGYTTGVFNTTMFCARGG